MLAGKKVKICEVTPILGGKNLYHKSFKEKAKATEGIKNKKIIKIYRFISFFLTIVPQVFCNSLPLPQTN